MKFPLPAPRRPLLLLAALLAGFSGQAQTRAAFNASSPQSLPVTSGGLPLFSGGLLSVLGSVDYAGTPATLSGTTVIGGDLRLSGQAHLTVTSTGKLYVYGNLLLAPSALTIEAGGHVYFYGDQLAAQPQTAINGAGTLHLISPRPAPGSSADGQQRAATTDGLPGGAAGAMYVDGGGSRIDVDVEHRAASGLTLADLDGQNAGYLLLGGRLTLALDNAPVTLGPENLYLDVSRAPGRARLVGYSPLRYVQTNGPGRLYADGLLPDSSFVYPVGNAASGDYTPARITNRDTGPHYFAVRVTPTTPAPGKPSVGRYWAVLPDDDAALFDLTLEHNVATQQAGYTDASAVVARFDGGSWQQLGGPRAGSSPGMLSTTGPVAGASDLGISGTVGGAQDPVFTKQSATPLPVVLTQFTAQHRAGTPTVELAWETASELNTAGFEVQRSADGRSWTKIGYVAGAGNSTHARHYGMPTPYVGAAYYRLRQVDLDGTFSFSPPRFIGADPTTEPFAAYPSPTTGDFRVSGADPTRPVEILSMLGQVLAVLPAGIYSSDYIAPLASGAYVVRQGARKARLLVR